MPGQAPEFLIENPELLLEGSYVRDGFDLIITGPDGTVVVVHDYFSFNPPPNLVLASGNGLSPEMVKALLHDRFEGMMFAGPAENTPVLEQIGVVRFASGTVKRINANGEETLKTGDPLYEGDEIVVEGRGFMVANMNDGTRFTQGANSRTTLANFEFDETARTGSFEAKVLQGGFSFRSGKIGEYAGNTRDHTKISTPSAVIRVRGSELDGTVDPVTLQTFVIHKSGYLTVTDINESNPVILDTPNNSTLVISGGVPTSAGAATPEQLAAVQQSLPPATVIEQIDQEDAQNEGDTGEETGDETQTGAEGEQASAGEGNGEPEVASDESADGDIGEEEVLEESEEGDDDAEEEDLEADNEEAEESDEEETSDEETAESDEAVEADSGDGVGDGSAESGTGDGASAEEGGADEAASDGDGGTEQGQAAEGDQGDGGESGESGDQGGDETGSNSSGTSNSGNNSGSLAQDAGTTGTSGTGGSKTGGTSGGTSGGTTGGSTGTQGGTGVSGSGNNQPNTTPELPPDNPPTSENDAVTIAENETREISELVLANDDDPDANQSPRLSSVNTSGTLGTVTLDTANQTLSYTAIGSQFDSLGAGETATDRFNYTVSSGQFSSSSTVTVTIEGRNDLTVAVDDSYATDGGVNLVIDAASGLLANDTDLDVNDTLTVINATVTSEDATEVTVNADGSFEFLAASSDFLNGLAAGETFTSTIVYTVQSSAGDTTTATANIVVTGVNTPPTTNDDTAALLENATVTVQPLANDTDIDGDDLTLTAATVVGGNGTVTISGNDLIFTPTTNLPEDGTLQETVIYTVSDGQATSTGNIIVTITGVNDPPEIIVQTPATTPQIQATSGPTDITNLVLAVVGDDSPGTEITALDNSNTVGSVILGSVIYDATGFFDFLNVGETFTDSFGFTATDIQGLSTNGTFNITILGEADAPVVSGPLSFTNSEDDAPLVLDLLTNASDVDTTDVLSLTNIVITGNDAGIAISGTNLNFNPDAYTNLSAGDSEVITISYDVIDTTGLTAAQTATITITGVNDAPDVVPVTVTFTESDPIGSADFLSGSSDVEGDNLSLTNLTLVSGLDSGITISGSTLTVNPSAYDFLAIGESEVIQYTFDVSDGNGGSTPGTLQLTIVGENDAPTTTSVTVTTAEDVPRALVPSDFPFSDVDSTDLLEGIRVDSLPILGQLQLSGVNVIVGQFVSINDLVANNLTYTPALNDNGVAYASFNFSVNDGTDFSTSSIMTFNVTPVNDAPIVTPITLTVTEDDGITNGDFLAGAIDVENDPINIANVTLVSGSDSGVAISGSTFSVAPSEYDFLGTGESEVIVYSFDVQDGNGGNTPNTGTITVTGVNDAPTTMNTSFTSLEDTPIVFSGVDFPFMDIDSSDLLEFVRIDSLPLQGSLQLSGVNVNIGQVVSINDLDNGFLVFTPALNQFGAPYTSFNFSVGDDEAFSGSGIASIDITPVNDNPVAVDDAYNVPFNGSFTATFGTDDLLLNDSDVEGDLITINLSPVSGPANGSVSIFSDGTFSYTPDFNFTGTDTFVYEITDGNGGSAQGTATLTITGSPGVFALLTGDYSDTGVYSGGAVPTAGDDLIISSGVTLTLDGTTPGPVALQSVDIDGSGGFFDISNNTLNVGNSILMGAGSNLALTNATLSLGANFVSDGQFSMANSNLLLASSAYSNSGVLDVDPGTSTITALTADNDATLNIVGDDGNSTTSLTFTNDFNNNSNVNIQNLSASSRNLSISTAGTFGNFDTLSVLTGGGGGSKTLNATTFFQSGTVSIDTGQILDINATSTQVASDSIFTGSGTARFNGVQSIDIDASGFSIDSISAVFDLAGNISINGVGTLTIGSGGELVLTGDTVNADLNNTASLVIAGNTSTLTSPVFSNTGQTVIRGVSSASTTTLAFAASITNAGILLYDNAFTSARNLTLDASGQTFTNTGTVQTNDSNVGGGTRNFNADTFITTSGTLDVLTGDVLNLNVTTTVFGVGTNIVGGGTLNFTGTHEINLDTNFTVLSSHGPLDLSGNVTITGPGLLTIDIGAELVLKTDVINADVNILGTLTAINNTNTINGNITNVGPMGIISVLGTNSSSTVTLQIANGFTNGGIVEIDNSFTSARTLTLDVAAGTLVNTSVINSENSGGGGGSNRFFGNLSNNGSININTGSVIGSPGDVFTNTNGTVNVGSGANLEINASTFEIGTSTVLNGPGTISLTGTQTVDVQSAFTLLSSAPIIDPSGVVTYSGAGQLTIDSGAFFRLTSDTLAANFDNQGDTVFELAGSSVTSTSFVNSGNVIVKGVSGGSTSTVTFTNAVTNSGTFEFDNTFTSARTLTATGDINNSGTILSSNSGGGGGNYTLTGTVTNVGTVTANADFTINGASFDTASGIAITVGAGANLGLDSTTVTLGTGSSVTGGVGSILEFGGPTVTVTTAFDISSTSPEIDFTGFATINGPGSLNILGTGTLTLTTDTVDAGISNAGTLNIEENNTQINGTLTTLAGGLIEIRGTSASTNASLTSANTFSNVAGSTIELDNLFTSARNLTLNTSVGTFSNAGTLVTNDSGGGGGTYTVNGDLVNTGSIDVNHDVNIGSGILDNTTGSINVASGQTLNYSGSNITFGAATNVLGAGTLEVSGPQITLTTGFSYSASQPLFDLSGFLTIAGAGSLDVQAGGTFTLTNDTVNTSISNAGNLFIEENVTTINGSLTSNIGTIAIRGTNASTNVTLTVATGFTNNGTILLDNVFTSARNLDFNVSSSFFINDVGATLATANSGGGGGSYDVVADVSNQGTVQIDFDATITSTTFDTQSGTVNVGSGAILDLSATTTEIGTSTVLGGTGTIKFIGTQAINLNSDFTLVSSAPVLDFAGDIDITELSPATFTVDTGATLSLTGDDVSVSTLTNNGTINVLENTSNINNSFINTGTLQILGSTVSTVSRLDVQNNFNNGGTIILDNPTANNRTVILFFAGTFSNDVQLTTQETGVGNGTLAVQVTGAFSNDGTFDVNKSAQLIAGAASTNGSGGQINIAVGETLDINIASFTNDGTITLLGGSNATTLDLTDVTTLTNNGTITGSGTVVNSGVIVGGGTFSVSPGASPGQLIFDGDLNTEIDLLTELEGLTPGSGYDQVVVNGVANLGSSMMDVVLLNGYQPQGGDSYVALTADAITGHFGEVSGLDIATDRVLDIQYVDGDVILTAIATTATGDAQSNIIAGTNAQDVIVAGAGDDAVTTATGGDIVFGQDGNDTISVAADFNRVDGGAGIDRLVLSEVQIDDGKRIDGIEILEIEDGTASLSATTIAEISSGTNALTGLEDSLLLEGSSSAVVTLVGNFQLDRTEQLDSGSGLDTFDVYVDGDASVFVSQNVLVAHQAVMDHGAAAAPIDLTGVDTLVATSAAESPSEAADVSFAELFEAEDPLSALLANLPSASIYAGGEQLAVSTPLAESSPVNYSMQNLQENLLPLDQVNEL